MSRYIDADALIAKMPTVMDMQDTYLPIHFKEWLIDEAPSIDIVRCQDCKKSHIDGKTTHYLWCVEWGRSTDAFGYCERGERREP